MKYLQSMLEWQNKSSSFHAKEFFRHHLKRKFSLGEVVEKAFKEISGFSDSFSFVSPVSPPSDLRFIVYGDPDYPEPFYFMADPPLVLTLWGEAAWQGSRALSVVGSRKPTQESLHWIDQELGAFTQHYRVVLVSGGARGIDQAVHALAIRKKVPTIVFLPSGLLNLYPSELKSWVKSILEVGGGFVSEYPLQQFIRKEFFPHRNRLISQLGLATLVVQAAERSGTLITGHLAAEAGRPLWVVPGHPMHSSYKGNIKLLQEGANLISSANDLCLFFEAELITLNRKDIHIGDGELLNGYS